MLKSICAGIVVVGLGVAPAFAGQQPTAADKTDKTTAGKTAASSADHMFVMKVAKGGMA